MRNWRCPTPRFPDRPITDPSPHPKPPVTHTLTRIITPGLGSSKGAFITLIHTYPRRFVRSTMLRKRMAINLVCPELENRMLGLGRWTGRCLSERREVEGERLRIAKW